MNEILNKVDEIVDYIKENNDYTGYLKLKEIINNDVEIKTLLGEIQDIKRKLLKNSDKDLLNLLNTKQEILKNNPIYREYINKVEAINEPLLIIEKELNNYFSNKLN